jgi:protochlorophyllide reductase
MAKWTEQNIPDQTGRTIVVTGANSGLGLQAATMLAGKGARVLMACRSPERAKIALEQVNSPNAELVTLDLADLSSVHDAAAEIRERTDDKVDALINNAGVMMTPKKSTADGHELQFGTNHLGHAALTWQLMPALRGAHAGRVVTLSSFMAQLGWVDTKDPNFHKRLYLPVISYSQAKMANLLFAIELDKRLREVDSPVISVAAHPGYSATELQSNMARSRNSALLGRVMQLGNGAMAQPARIGALPEVFAAVAPEVRGGDYYGPGGFLEMGGPPKKVSVRRAHGQQRTRDRLWNLTAELTGVTPDPA